ncbi:MAG: TetR/AcrR family transcriptional regulator [Dehalococcoidia bacterium]
MSPRPYRLGQRRAATDQTRARIVAAAHDLLSAEEGLAGFSVDAVARRAGVARMTVYYQFGSKQGLIQALFDELAARGRLAERLPAAFSRPEPLEALGEVIAAFGRFWASDRLVIRRVRALAAVDPELEQGLRERDGWRRNGIRVVLGRLAGAYGRRAADAFDEAVDVAYTLGSFETFDTLAGATRDVEKITPIVQRLILDALGWGDR